MEYLEKNIDWLTDKLDGKEDHYLIIDCPGQVRTCFPLLILLFKNYSSDLGIK